MGWLVEDSKDVGFGHLEEWPAQVPGALMDGPTSTGLPVCEALVCWCPLPTVGTDSGSGRGQVLRSVALAGMLRWKCDFIWRETCG